MTNQHLIHLMNSIKTLRDIKCRKSYIKKNAITTIILHVLFQIFKFRVDHQNIDFIVLAIEFFHDHDSLDRFVSSLNNNHLKFKILQN